MVLRQLSLTKLKLEYYKSGFKCKKEKYNHRRKMFASLEFDVFRVQLKFAFRIRPLEILKTFIINFDLFLFSTI